MTASPACNVRQCEQAHKFTRSPRWSQQARSGQAGKERDGGSGHDYFLARYYSSAYGRFLSPDEFTGGPVDAFSSSDPLPPGPLPYADIRNPQSLNKYTYTYNNPLRYKDPDGHGVDTILDIIFITADILDLFKNPNKENAIALGLDILGAGIPFVTGLGRAFKTAKALERINELRAGSKAFDAALAGGKHAGFLANYATRSLSEISKGIESIGRQIAEHEAKLADPARFVKNWGKLSQKEKEGLIRKWQKDIERQKEQKEILEQLKKLKEQEVK